MSRFYRSIEVARAFAKTDAFLIRRLLPIRFNMSAMLAVSRSTPKSSLSLSRPSLSLPSFNTKSPYPAALPLGSAAVTERYRKKEKEEEEHKKETRTEKCNSKRGCADPCRHVSLFGVDLVERGRLSKAFARFGSLGRFSWNAPPLGHSQNFISLCLT